MIEKSNHILDLNDVWVNFKNHLEYFSVNALELVEGKVIYPEFTKQDQIFDSLFCVEDEDLNVLTIEALQIILLNFLIIVERQLFDNLPGGILNENTNEVDKDLRNQSKTVNPTNIISERDFVNFDRLWREKPNANIPVIALEGMILFTNNKTMNWLHEMETEKKANIFKIAREKAPEMIKQFKMRKTEIKKQHVLLLKKRQEEKIKKEVQIQTELENISKEIQKFGGLWQTISDVNANLKHIKEKDKLEAVKLQLKFRKKVLKSNPDNKTLLQFSTNNIPFSLNELISHLKILITSNASDVEADLNLNVQSFTIKSKEEREIIMEQQRGMVLKKIKAIQLKNKIKSSDNKVLSRDDITGTCNEPVSKKIKTNNLSSVDTNITNTISICTNEYKTGQFVAVAYIENWYPGQVIGVESNFLEVKFLHPSKSSENLFKWPEKEDISKIENIFVFFSEFDILPKRLKWQVMENY